MVHLTGYVIDEEDGFPDDYDDGDVDSGSTVSVSDSASLFFSLVQLKRSVSDSASLFFSLVQLNSFYATVGVSNILVTWILGTSQ